MTSPLFEVAYFPDFAGGKTIVLSGTKRALTEFAELLEALLGAGAGSVDLNNVEFIQCYGDVEVVLKIVDRKPGMKRTTKNANAFEWALSIEKIREFSELIRVVAGNIGPTHHYLECFPYDEVTVVASKGEYDLRAMFHSIRANDSS
ncbi:MAG: hypothetical protein FJ315_04790 [SAR202 cluster bacterium]|nr:hypothetical protein [SAR202 cluster bacterium]